MLICIDEEPAESGCTAGAMIKTAIVSREVLKVANDHLSANRLAKATNVVCICLNDRDKYGKLHICTLRKEVHAQICLTFTKIHIRSLLVLSHV